MPADPVDRGAAPNDPAADTVYEAFGRVNASFAAVEAERAARAGDNTFTGSNRFAGPFAVGPDDARRVQTVVHPGTGAVAYLAGDGGVLLALSGGDVDVPGRLTTGYAQDLVTAGVTLVGQNGGRVLVGAGGREDAGYAYQVDTRLAAGYGVGGGRVWPAGDATPYVTYVAPDGATVRAQVGPGGRLLGRVFQSPPLAVTVAGTVHDYDPGPGHPGDLEVSTAGGPATLTGLAGGLPGDRRLVTCGGPDVLSLAHADAGSGAANRFKVPAGDTVLLAPDDAALLVRDAAGTAWRVYPL